MRVLVLSLVLSLLGCGSPEVPDTHMYMLRVSSDFAGADSSYVVGLAAVEVPAYLKRSELILQVGPQELRPARYHRWAEPLDENVRRYLRERLSTELNTNVEMNARLRDRWDVQIDVAIEELHGTLEGSALLSASYAIVRSAEPERVQRGRVRLTESQRRDGYAGLVDAQSELLDGLANRIAADVNAMTDLEE
jgi:uncharacterized lipoprotein YmbA